MLLGLLEETLDSLGSDSDVAVDELRGRHVEEGDACLSGAGLGQESLASSWRSNKEGSFGNLSADFLVLLGVFEKIDEFLDFQLDLFHACEIFEFFVDLLKVNLLDVLGGSLVLSSHLSDCLNEHIKEGDIKGILEVESRAVIEVKPAVLLGLDFIGNVKGCQNLFDLRKVENVKVFNERVF